MKRRWDRQFAAQTRSSIRSATYVERERVTFVFRDPDADQVAGDVVRLIAADGLSANRRAVSRIELPRSIAPTMRSRRSMEMGAGMTTSR
jgi:hypothetical protein